MYNTASQKIHQHYDFLEFQCSIFARIHTDGEYVISLYESEVNGAIPRGLNQFLEPA